MTAAGGRRLQRSATQKSRRRRLWSGGDLISTGWLGGRAF